MAFLRLAISRHIKPLKVVKMWKKRGKNVEKVEMMERRTK